MQRLVERLAVLQHASPARFVLVAFLLGALGVPLVLRLELETGFEQLLPSDEPSIRDLEAARARMRGLSTLTVAVLSRDREAMQRFAEDLGPRLQRLRGHHIEGVDWNIHDYQRFVEEHRELYASLADLERLRDTLKERVDYEKLAKNPLYVRLTDEPPPDPMAVIDEIRAERERKQAESKRFENGFFLHETVGMLAIFVHTDMSSSDVEKTERLFAAVREQVAQLDPSRYASDLRVELAGDLVSVSEEHDALANEMLIATVLTTTIVLALILIFFKRVRALPILGLSMVPPLLLTFGFATLAVGSLNTSTIFLGSILIGNGVNPAVLWLARYFEARRAKLDVLAALQVSHVETWVATLSASLAAGVSYASLMLTDFRGFRDFGVISGVGMVLCWTSSLVLLPAITLLVERWFPMRELKYVRVDQAGPYGALFWRMVHTRPHAILRVAAISAAACSALVAYAIYHDPIEYDFSKQRSIRKAATESSLINGYVSDIIGRSSTGNSILVLLDDRAQAQRWEQKLEHAPHAVRTQYGAVRTIDDLLPRDQAQKLLVLGDVRRSMLDARRFANETEAKDLDENLPSADLRALTSEDLPTSAARPFTERDGARGRLIYVSQADDQSTWDGRYLIRWTNALRGLAPEGEMQPLLVGNAPVFADILQVVWKDGPKAVALALLATCALVMLTFRSVRSRVLTLASLGLGVTWMVGVMALLRIRLNFLNFVCFPITFGNGVDYAVNVMQRYDIERARLAVPEAVRETLRNSGGAVVLNSLTTIVGYSSLHVSANQALRSFGLAMTISEASCLLVAMAVLPAYLLTRAPRSEAKHAPPELEPEPEATREPWPSGQDEPKQPRAQGNSLR